MIYIHRILQDITKKINNLETFFQISHFLQDSY